VRRVVFHPLAEREFIEAARFYEGRAGGLGGDYIRQVEHALEQIAANPEAGNVLTGTLRRWVIQRFPFAIVYQSGAEELSVIAVMHLRRRPGYWKRRLGIPKQRS